MLHQTPGPDRLRQIEAQLELDRRALSGALESLRGRFSQDQLWADGANLVKAKSAPYRQAVDAAVQDNPLALTVTALGLGWLMLGRGSKKGKVTAPHSDDAARPEDEGGPVVAPRGADADWIEDADRLQLRAADLIAQINTAARDQRAPAAALAKSRADVDTALTKDVTRIMAKGLENLSGPARDAALKARCRAYNAHLAEVKVGRNNGRTDPFVQDIVLAVGGAIIAALVPQSDCENALITAPCDRILKDPARILHGDKRRFARLVGRAAQALTAEFMPGGSGIT